MAHTLSESQWVLVDETLHALAEFAHLPPSQRPAAICPVCREPVLLKLGSKRTHHYAHYTGAICATTNPETALHLNTKCSIATQLRDATAQSVTVGSTMDAYRSYRSHGAIIVLGYFNVLKRTMVRLDGNIVGLGLHVNYWQGATGDFCGSLLWRASIVHRINRLAYPLIVFIIGISLGLLIPHVSNSDDETQAQKDYIAALLATQWINAQWNLETAYDSFEKTDESNAYSHLNEAVTRLYQAQSIGSIYHRLYLDSANPEHDVYVVDVPGYYLMDINKLINQPYGEPQKQVLTTIIEDIRTYNNYMSSDRLSRKNSSDIQNSIQQLRLELHSSHLPNYTGK